MIEGDLVAGRPAAEFRIVRDLVHAGGWLGAIGTLPDAAEMLNDRPSVVRGGRTATALNAHDPGGLIP